MTSVLLEAKPYRPFKSSEEYLEAMKEDLAEWLSIMYPELNINAENFMNRLDTGVALCRHANNVRKSAEEYLAKRQARNKSMTRSVTSGLAGPILANLNVHYLPAAKSGTFFARDNVSNFITWCRKSLKILECLLFETDDLIMRKNEKHVILCLLEVARRGAKFGMLAPMLIQMERQIDREIAADNRANGINSCNQIDITSWQKSIKTEDIFESDSENEDEEPMLFYGPQPQIVTNDLKSLDEMVRDLVEKCTCPSQFPMVRVSEGKYRIGDTKVLIFVRILRSHVMVRVGGGWDTLSHYLDKHDPCRCKSAHRASISARLIPRTNNQNNGIELHKAHVIYERSPPVTRKSLTYHQIPTALPNSTRAACNTSPTTLLVNQNKSRSPTPQKKFFNQQNTENTNEHFSALASPKSNFHKRSISPSPKKLNEIRRKQSAFDINNQTKLVSDMTAITTHNHIQTDDLSQPKEITSPSSNSVTIVNLNSSALDSSVKFDNGSDNGSEISDEGYRSLGLQQINNQKCELLQQISVDDADLNARPCQNSCDSQFSPRETKSKLGKMMNIGQSSDSNIEKQDRVILPSSLKADTKNKLLPNEHKNSEDILQVNEFERSGIFITDDDIIVDIAGTTGLRKTGFSDKIYGGEDLSCIFSTSEEKLLGNQNKSDKCSRIINGSKIPRSPNTVRRKSIDVVKNNVTFSGFNRMIPEYRSARSPKEILPTMKNQSSLDKPILSNDKPIKPYLSNNSWNGRNKKKFYPTFNEHPIRSSSLNSHFEKKSKLSNSHILYDCNGKKISSKSTSLTTSPIKCKNMGSPLARQLLKVANNAKNDTQMLEKMKILLQQYGKESYSVVKKSDENFNDNGSYTSEWVRNNGDLEQSDSSSSSSEFKKYRELKRNNSVVSSIDITYGKSPSTNTFIPKSRIDFGGISRIPAPIRRNTELY